MPLEPNEAQAISAGPAGKGQPDGRCPHRPDRRHGLLARWQPGARFTLLASSLRRETLDYLIGLAPEAWEARDRVVSPQLLRAFETRVLARAVSQLDEPTELFLRRLAVFRQPLHRKALDAVATTEINMGVCRDNLISLVYHRTPAWPLSRPPDCARYLAITIATQTEAQCPSDGRRLFRERLPRSTISGEGGSARCSFRGGAISLHASRIRGGPTRDCGALRASSEQSVQLRITCSQSSGRTRRTNYPPFGLVERSRPPRDGIPSRALPAFTRER